MPYNNAESRRAAWNAWYHRNKETFDRTYAQRRLANKERIRQAQKAYYQKLRLKAIEHYGGQCACCGEAHIEFLSIDHVNGRGSGAEHRKALGGRAGSWFYLWLRKAQYPLGLRVLCNNCNMSLGMYGYCPHTESISHWRINLEQYGYAQKPIIICEYCHKEYQAKSSRARFCSNACWQKNARALKMVDKGLAQLPDVRAYADFS